MKVDEPKTPYEREVNIDDEMDGGVDPEELSLKYDSILCLKKYTQL